MWLVWTTCEKFIQVHTNASNGIQWTGLRLLRTDRERDDQACTAAQEGADCTVVVGVCYVMYAETCVAVEGQKWPPRHRRPRSPQDALSGFTQPLRCCGTSLM